MWHFATEPTLRRPAPQGRMTDPAPQAPGMMTGLPPSASPPLPVVLPSRLPPWQAPSFWSLPVAEKGDACVTWYNTWVSVLRYQVPDTRMLMVSSVSLEVQAPRTLYETLFVRVMRNEEEMARWEECVTRVPIAPATTVDTGTNVAYGGLLSPAPFYGRFSQNDRIEVQVMPVGVIGTAADGSDVFAHNSGDFYGGQLAVHLEGWLSNLMDTREGAPRPIDPAIDRDQAGRPVLTGERWLLWANKLRAALGGVA